MCDMQYSKEEILAIMNMQKTLESLSQLLVNYVGPVKEFGREHIRALPSAKKYLLIDVLTSHLAFRQPFRLRGRVSKMLFRVNAEYAQITEIIDGLYICGVTSLNAENMEKYNISLIINATTEVSCPSYFK
uniref:Uncharacterized protein n=1 Tax=Ascaris lumbricoides TaxID=6252 RepID=A0A9J2PC68_ASCLU